MACNLKCIIKLRNLTVVFVAILPFILLTPFSARSTVTLQLTNNFASGVPNGSNYFSSNYSDDEVWLYFLNTNNCVTYHLDNDDLVTVSDNDAFTLSTVKNKSFTLAVGCDSTKLFAGLGSTSPFSGANGPGIFDTDVPYALIEWTINGNVNDNIDVTYEDSISFPTCLTVKDSGDTQTAQACFQDGTRADHIINALKNVMPNTPTGPNNDNYPKAGDAAGWGPLVPTVSGDSSANRWIGSSKYWQSAATSNLASYYLYAPSFNDYLKYLKANESKLFGKDGISGWYVDYSGNGGYSFYVSVTGVDNNYGLRIHDVRFNTNISAANTWEADSKAGDRADGEIIIAANNAEVVDPAAPDSHYIGYWTDATIYSGASLITPDFATGPVITGTEDFVPGGAHVDLTPTIIASLSASMATGLLGSETYVNKIKDTVSPGGTCYWFQTLERSQALTTLFDSAWTTGNEFYDPYWHTMAVFTNMQGYLSPFNDRWANFSPDFTLSTDYKVSWELGITSTTQAATLTMAVSPEGRGTTVPSEGDHSENEGTLFSIKANPASGYAFEKWTVSGNADIQDTTDPSTWVTLSGDATVTAVFKPASSFPWILYQTHLKK